MSKDMLVMELSCAQCGAVLTEGTRLHLDGNVRKTNEDGEIYLSAVFGDYSVATDLTLAEGEIVDFRCPKCDASIMLPVQCKLCGAPMASLDIRKGGYLEFCSRRGCKAHALGGTGNIDDLMSLMNRMFDTPYD